MTASYSAIVRAVIAAPMPCGMRVSWQEVHSHFRASAFVEARVLIATLAKLHLRDPSWTKIGRLMGRDHTTVIYNVRRYLREDLYFRPALLAAHERLYPKARRCRVCGCTDDMACTCDDGAPCHWATADTCSACAGVEAA